MRKGIIIGGIAAAVAIVTIGVVANSGKNSAEATTEGVGGSVGSAMTESLRTDGDASKSDAPTKPPVVMVTVPSLDGLTPAKATSNLTALGLKISVSGDTSNPAFGVLTQEPAVAARVEYGSIVRVTVGESPAQIAAREAAAAKAAADAEAARVAAEAAAAAAAADADLSTYQEIDTRTWALVAKDPEAHVGEKYVIYGRVTQFDSATGKSAFLAHTDGEQQEEYYDYETNTMISAKDAGAVADIVEDDLVKMYVRVTGSLSYKTQIGGNTTVPQVIVNSHELIGHTD